MLSRTPEGMPGDCRGQFGLFQSGQGMPPTPSGYELGVPLQILESTGQPPRDTTFPSNTLIALKFRNHQ